MVTRRALVTGATGGLGRGLVPQLLAAGYTVVATGRDRVAGAALQAAGATFMAADLLSDSPPPLMAGVDVVFHLAALSSPWGRSAQFEAINVAATARLLAAARQAGCTAFIHASTPSVYAAPCDRLNLTEASALADRPVNDYARTKLAAERLVLAANAPDFHTVALRPRAIVGRHDRVLLPRLLRAARHGRVPIPRGGCALVELTDVRDAASAFVAADRCRLPAQGRAINISGGQPRTLRALLTFIFARLDRPVRLVSVPASAALAAARLAEIVAACWPGQPEPPVTRHSIMALAYSQTFDLAVANTLLGWRPEHSPEEAIIAALPGAAGHA